MVAPSALQNQRIVYGILFRAAAETLLQSAADREHLGARIGFLAVLHTWGQNLHIHPHLHCVVPGGGIAPDRLRWIACRRQFLLPVKVLSRLFRAKFGRLLAPSFSSRRTKLPWPVAAACARAQFHRLAKPDCPTRVGGLSQTTLWWTATSPEVPGALYPSRGDRQPAPGCASGRSRELSLEGLYARRSSRGHDARAAPCHHPTIFHVSTSDTILFVIMR
jgi:hypothetical protein